ncbi:Pycsar system effector family protein [Streptomyces sp. VTCC 41912]|uniref:Pycsar system effector family protein n=1 Tax=Streptomyces sp. VTCC 41912 TaxID=3383243 RepID=UPI003896C4E7
MEYTEQNWANVLSDLKNEIGRADSKSGNILTLDGLLVAALGLMGRNTGGAALVAEVAGILALTASVLLALLVIRPRLAAPGGTTDRISFVHLATATPEEITAAMRQDRRTTTAQTLSRIALRKMKIQRWAGDAAFAAAAAIGAAIIMSH